jgi:hypothetical protein
MACDPEIGKNATEIPGFFEKPIATVPFAQVEQNRA